MSDLYEIFSLLGVKPWVSVVIKPVDAFVYMGSGIRIKCNYFSMLHVII